MRVDTLGCGLVIPIQRDHIRPHGGRPQRALLVAKAVHRQQSNDQGGAEQRCDVRQRGQGA